MSTKAESIAFMTKLADDMGSHYTSLMRRLHRVEEAVARGEMGAFAVARGEGEALKKVHVADVLTHFSTITGYDLDPANFQFQDPEGELLK